ncbi:MAG: DNA polymerase III subunit delta [bacterium]|nr:DNA polymerase III subunit delta [bacterium]
MIIFLHGDDTFRSREKLRELKEKFLREVDPSGSNLVVLDGATVSASDLWGAVAAQSFLVRKRMVVVEDLGAQKSATVREEIAALLGKIPSDAIVVFWEGRSCAANAKRKTQNAKPKKRALGAKQDRSDPLFPLLLKEKFAQEFSPLDGVALTRWVQDRVKALDATMDPAATRELIAAVGADLWRMANEVEKLTIAAQGEPITTSLIHNLVDTVPPDNIFAFVDAVGRGDRAGALRILRELEAARVDPHHLLSMLHRQLRLLVQAADLLDRGTPATQLAAELRVHPFVAQKLAQQTRTSSLSALRTLYPRLLELDRKLKSSRAPWGALMDLFCVEVTQAA